MIKIRTYFIKTDVSLQRISTIQASVLRAKEQNFVQACIKYKL